ncbi:MAG TPA: hypothetical protein VE863_10845 [Pyrinomonadaceae bacterium]|nr:hypothetical protein [Pyrinomonadaceae bacterium]
MNAKFQVKTICMTFAFAVILLFAGAQTAQAQWTTSGSNTTTTNNVGVGTTSPGQSLSVNGNIEFKGNDGIRYVITDQPGTGATRLVFQAGFGSTGVGGALNLWGAGHASKPGWATIGLPSAGSGSTASRFTINDGGLADGNDIFTVLRSGNVGIGTTAPGQKLDVNGNITANGYLQVGTDAIAGDRRIYGFSNIARTATSFGMVIGNADTSSTASVSKYGGYFYTSGTWNGTSANSVGIYATATGGTNNYAAIFDQGNVGIGTTSPLTKLHTKGQGFFESANLNGVSIIPGASLQTIESDWNSGGADTPLLLKTQNSGNQLYLATSGNIGIGTTPSASYKLDVAGNINSSATITGNNIVAKYQDMAEWVPSSEKLSAGTVVVLDSTKSNQVTSSSVSYDTRVAGVISEQPGIALGEKTEGKLLVATTGRVRVKVDATKSPIHIGDLLVTSDVPGMAMKSEPIVIGNRKIHAPGTLIGKALEPFEKGKGTILVLLSLQ